MQNKLSINFIELLIDSLLFFCECVGLASKLTTKLPGLRLVSVY